MLLKKVSIRARLFSVGYLIVRCTKIIESIQLVSGERYFLTTVHNKRRESPAIVITW